MANVQSPPGLLSIFELLNTIGVGYVAFDVSGEIENADPFQNTKDYYSIHTMIDLPNVNILEHFRQEKKYPVQVKFIYIRIAIHNGDMHHSFKTGTCIKEYLDDDTLFNDTLSFLNRHRCRGLLSGKHLKSYVLYNYAYHELPGEFWSYDENWYRLLVDGCAHGSIPSIGNFAGSVYFKAEDVKRCANILPNKQSAMMHSSALINLDTYNTPWLQTLSAIYEEYGKDKLAKVSKISVEYFIKDYIKKHELDISQSDIPFLAKFMRLAEQKDGKKYHAEQKLKNNKNG